MLHITEISVEGSLIWISRAVNVAFLHLLLRGEQRFDGCVNVIELVLVLTKFVAEDIQGVGLDRVLQVAPAVFHGDVLISI
ncbi:unnamed protein product [Schistocephalus solidus]|uniref:Secreted protein n=1 Tax=Schistocephalus solidus TaxID=70667 RepID=A0A183TM12_SCHSO|nr:unnamed protein product [Schistocephalus solidus]